MCSPEPKRVLELPTLRSACCQGKRARRVTPTTRAPRQLPGTAQTSSSQREPDPPTTAIGCASAHALSSTSLKSAVSWAPETAYFRSNTKNGTPVAPNARARSMSARTSASNASESRTAAASVVVEADLDGQTQQFVPIADPDALAEITTHQAFGELIAHTLGGREMQQAMRPEGVGRVGILQLELEADGGRDVTHPVVHRPRFRGGPTVLLGEHLVQGEVGRDGTGWIQLERAVCHRDLVRMLEGRKCLFHPSLADVAPRAHHIGEDLDLHANDLS